MNVHVVRDVGEKSVLGKGKVRKYREKSVKKEAKVCKLFKSPERECMWMQSVQFD